MVSYLYGDKKGMQGFLEKEDPAFKKMWMWIEKIALVCLVLFAIVGVFEVGIIVHEYSHYNDFRELNVTNEELCGLVLPLQFGNWSYFIHTPLGYYSFKKPNDPVERIKYDVISKNTEIRAYILSACTLIFFVICYRIILFSRYDDKEKLLEQEIDGKEKDIYIHQLESYILNDVNSVNIDDMDDMDTEEQEQGYNDE